MNVVKEINSINMKELEGNGGGSWHDTYKDSAYVFVGGLPFNLTEGDVIAIFSQYGEIADINLPRDKETSRPRGFAFVMYLDQRSTVLAVDNLNGSKVLGRTLRVDHTRNYEQPKGRDADGEVVEPEEQSMNAMPQMLGGSSAAAGRIAGGAEDDVDEEDPMAGYIRSNRIRESLEGGGSSFKKPKKEKKHKDREPTKLKKDKSEKKDKKHKSDRVPSSSSRHHHRDRTPPPRDRPRSRSRSPPLRPSDSSSSRPPRPSAPSFFPPPSADGLSRGREREAPPLPKRRRSSSRSRERGRAEPPRRSRFDEEDRRERPARKEEEDRRVRAGRPRRDEEEWRSGGGQEGERSRWDVRERR